MLCRSSGIGVIGRLAGSAGVWGAAAPVTVAVAAEARVAGVAQVVIGGQVRLAVRAVCFCCAPGFFCCAPGFGGVWGGNRLLVAAWLLAVRTVRSLRSLCPLRPVRPA